MEKYLAEKEQLKRELYDLGLESEKNRNIYSGINQHLHLCEDEIQKINKKLRYFNKIKQEIEESTYFFAKRKKDALILGVFLVIFGTGFCHFINSLAFNPLLSGVFNEFLLTSIIIIPSVSVGYFFSIYKVKNIVKNHSLSEVIVKLNEENIKKEHKLSEINELEIQKNKLSEICAQCQININNKKVEYIAIEKLHDDEFFTSINDLNGFEKMFKEIVNSEITEEKPNENMDVSHQRTRKI